eukprot:jgi/Chlat1/7126/Chrsp57S06739
MGARPYLLACGRLVSALTVDNFYPFGVGNGDTMLPKGVDNSSPLVALPFPVPVFGMSGVNGMYINNNGHISFDRSVAFTTLSPDDDTSVVAGWSGDLSTSRATCGNVTYRTIISTSSQAEQQHQQLLTRLSDDVRATFPADPLATEFHAQAAVVATWNKVYTCWWATLQVSPRTTIFQIVIAMDIKRVFVLLLYVALDTSSTSSKRASAGFGIAGTQRFYYLPGSGALAVKLVAETSNVGGQEPQRSRPPLT